MTVKHIFQIVAALYFVVAGYFGWLYIQGDWLPSPFFAELVDPVVYEGWDKDLLMFGPFCLAAAFAMLLLPRRNRKRQIMVFFAAWLTAPVIAVVASYLLTIPLWVTLGISVAALVLIDLLVEVSDSTPSELLLPGPEPAPTRDQVNPVTPKQWLSRQSSPLSDGDTLMNTIEGRTINLDIEEAMQQGNLTVHYQPVFDIRGSTPKLVEAEALVRWNHPTLGMLSPADLNIWDASDRLQTEMTDYVLKCVVEQHFAWKKQNIRFPVSVNLSIAMLNDGEFPQRLANLLAEHDVDRRLLCLELGEPRPTILPDITLEILDRLAQDGFHTVLDNFARNAVFLGELARIPWAGLKINGGLIWDLVEHESVRKLVRGIIHLAHDLGMPAYAESVEEPQSALILRTLGCDKAQGWYFGKPMPASNLTKLLMDQNRTADFGQTAAES